MDELHPLLREHGWVAGTGPVTKFNAAVTTRLRLGQLSLPIVGPSGAGKTSMAYDLFTALADGKLVVPWRASAVGIRTVADTPKFYRTFETFNPRKPSGPRLPVLSDQERAVNAILLSCDEAKVQRIILFLDEAQELAHATLVSLKATTQRLAEQGVQSLVLLMGEADLLNKPAELASKPGGGSLIRRFFASPHLVEGLTQQDLTALLEHVDKASWPANGGPKFTEYFAPTLFKNGWRMEAQAALLWAEFQSIANAMLLGDGLRVLPCHAVLAIRYMLTTLQQDPKKASAMPQLVKAAVAASGFVEAQQRLQSASNSPRKSKGRTK